MNPMNMPGFTAEKSIYRTSDHYRAISNTRNDARSSREVLPQLPIGFCQANCDSIQDSFLRSVCVLRCFDQQVEAEEVVAVVHFVDRVAGGV